ncbi:class I SAM-dependent methyltransferase [Serratia microhaemolytica]|uniref:class I SAM-dependent methyltransferase n=1 Tax=Serratia microhaemolytica TaxID=2675110 RepID=UPI000FDD60D1|nr:class I SAM-dependent methyltransferase [Serratia microhaemolytica]
MNFEDLAFLFTNDNRNRGVIRMNFDEAACLWRAVKSTEGNILEIGRRHGGSTVLLLAASEPDRKVISVDLEPAHHASADSFFVRPEIASRLELVIGDSRIPRGETLGLLFVDGDHSYEGVVADIVAHWAQLVPCGLVVFHDAVPNDGLAHINEINHCPGVTEACRRMQKAGIAISIASAGSVLVMKKLAELSNDIF